MDLFAQFNHKTVNIPSGECENIGITCIRYFIGIEHFIHVVVHRVFVKALTIMMLADSILPIFAE